MELKTLIFYLCIFNVYVVSSEIIPFVINGTDATIEEFPFMVVNIFY